MNKKTNIKSMMIGAALGVLGLLAVAASTTQTLPFGRFQLVATDNYIFKIDTTTGQVWRSYANSTSKEFMAPNVVEANSDK
jgi:hypothetical protein